MPRSIAVLRRSSRATWSCGLAAVAVLVLAPAQATAASGAAGEEETVDPVVAALSQRGTPKTPISLRSPDDGGARYVAKVLRTSTVRSRPRDGASKVGEATDRTGYLGQGNRLLVLSARYDIDGRPWVRVLLPVRPNGTAGWMRADDAAVRVTHWGIRVRLGRREVTVYRRGRVVRRFRSVIGTSATPTPVGLFSIYEIAPQRDPRGFIGPWALHLSGFSTVLENFGSGPGRVAIHGRDGASFRDPLGSARSHGCVRVNNSEVVWMQKHLLNGTPVRITR